MRRWRDQVVTLSFAAAGAVQAWAVLSGTRPIARDLQRARRGEAVRRPSACSARWPATGTRSRCGGICTTRPSALGAVAVLALITPALRVGGSRRWLAIWAGVGSALAFAACFAEPAVVPHLKVDVVSSLTRYDVLASLLMLTAIAAGLDALRWPANLAVRVRRRRRVSCRRCPSTSSGRRSYGRTWRAPPRVGTPPSPTPGWNVRLRASRDGSRR